MKALWIRVEAHKVDSVETAQLAEALGIDPVVALGHMTALGGAVAEHTEEGHIADVPNSTLEGWARWKGKKGELARAVREFLQDGDGKYDHWEETMGKLVEPAWVQHEFGDLSGYLDFHMLTPTPGVRGGEA
jgi:hypothetical protein